MAKFRRNHSKTGAFSGTFIRVLAFLFIAGISLVYLYRLVNAEEDLTFAGDTTYEIPTSSDPSERFYIPISRGAEIVHHTNYSLGYNEKHEQAEWVAYELRKDQLIMPNVKRERQFRPDYDVSTRSAFHRDYSHSGYTRGHLAPAGDMAFDLNAMKESFYMSNMSPQLEQFNGGIWRELEENVRDWAYKDNRLYIVTGPVLSKGIIKKIGDNKVSVPKYFYKVILDVSGKNLKGIGFIIENKLSSNHLSEYAMTIDNVEVETGLDFFPDLMNDELEEELESNLNIQEWNFDANKFKDRNSRWK